MILLTTVSDLIQIVSVSTVALEVHASFVDLNGSTVTPGRLNTPISTATTTNVVASPGSSTTRNLKSMFVANTDPSASETITVQHTDGTNVMTLWEGTLNAGDTLQYNENDGYTVIDKTGARKIAAATGRFLKQTYLTSGTSFITSSQTNNIIVEMVGGGGGGGGCTSVASAAAAAGGGGGGAYTKKAFAVSPNTSYTYAIGAAGSATSGAAGGNGGSTTFAVSGVTATAPGGTGGPLATSTITVGTCFGGGVGGVAGVLGDVNTPGEAGGGGTMNAVTPLGLSGNGGHSIWGEGGIGVVAAGNGTAGSGNGAGGAGSLTGSSAARAGGAGTVGAILVTEYT